MTTEIKEAPFTFVDPFARPKPMLDDDDKAQLLAGLQLVDGATQGVYVSREPTFMQELVAAAGLSWQDMLRASTYPSLVAVLPRDVLMRCANHVIYHVTDLPSFNAKYYFNFISGRIWLRYQHILGSRLLCAVSDDELEQLRERLVDQLRAWGRGPQYQQVLKRSGEIQKQLQLREAAQARAQKVSQANGSRTLQQLATLQPQDNFLKLPQEQLSEYASIKRLLETAGAKYSTAKNGFLFETDVAAAEVLDALLAGEKVNPKKDFQFFASTEAVTRLMRSQLPPSLAGKDVLEPSAGDGALADLAQELGGNVTTVELWEKNATKLQAKGYAPLVQDFLTLSPSQLGLFDVIVANPPFTKGQDLEHFQHMVKFLKPHGLLCCVLSTGWQSANSAKARAFRAFLETADVRLDALPAGTFKESGTSVGAVLVTLRNNPSVTTAVVAQTELVSA